VTRVAVTGGGGFVGRHVVAALERRGLSPILVSRNRSSIPDAWPSDRIAHMDIADPPADAYDQLGRPEVLIHLAWGGLPRYSSAYHVDHELPVHASFLEGLLAAGLAGLTVAGTCLEYGMQSGALSEEMPTAPVTSYGRAKDELRRHLERLRASSPFHLTWARLFYLYGEGQAPGSLLPQLEQAIARGDASFDMSGGEQLRDYLPVEEAAGYLVELALSGRDHGVVNVCSGQPTSVRELVEGVVARSASSIKLNLGRFPYPEYEPMAFWGDRKKLDRCLESIREAV
jgi:dTDP-6-deoxy-L-talose 4-dehydrogenase (NAD+)